MKLFIDTTDFNQITYTLIGDRVKQKSYKVDSHQSHQTLPRLEQFLKSAGVRVEQNFIKQIYVNKGPGSYTGTRIGVTHALALGFAWNVKVMPLPKDKFERKLKQSIGK